MFCSQQARATIITRAMRTWNYLGQSTRNIVETLPEFPFQHRFPHIITFAYASFASLQLVVIR